LTVTDAPSATQKPSTNILTPAEVTFADRAGDAFTSDGGGTYYNSSSLEVGFWSKSRDLVLRGSGRALNIDYTNLISGSGPTGTTVETSIFMNIHQILDMAPGTTRSTIGVFRTSVGPSVSWFRFNAPAYPDATLVHVDRALDGTWTVTADASTSTDRAALTQTKGNRETLMAYYSMPFQLSVVCPTCF
jgi:hypothetical protein